MAAVVGYSGDTFNAAVELVVLLVDSMAVSVEDDLCLDRRAAKCVLCEDASRKKTPMCGKRIVEPPLAAGPNDRRRHIVMAYIVMAEA